MMIYSIPNVVVLIILAFSKVQAFSVSQGCSCTKYCSNKIGIPPPSFPTPTSLYADTIENECITETPLTEVLLHSVKKMDQVMKPQFFESTSSLKALYDGCAKTVDIKESYIKGAGLGLFAKKNIKAGTIISFYPSHALGVEIETEEQNLASTFVSQPTDQEYFDKNPCTSSCYLHCTDQPLFKRNSILSTQQEGMKDIPLYLDANPTKAIVPAWVSQMINDGATVKTNSEQGVLDYYNISKKMRNCIHIPFGPSPIMATVTTRKVKKGEEFFTTYGGTYWLGVLLEIRGEEGVGITFKIQKEIQDTAADLVACMKTVSTVYANQAKEIQTEFDSLHIDY